MNASQFFKGDIIELKVIIEGETKEVVIGYVTDINIWANKLGIYLLKDLNFLKAHNVTYLHPIGLDYVISPLRETTKETLYEMMDFALDTKDFEYAKEIHERLYA